MAIVAAWALFVAACGGGDGDGETSPFATATRADASPPESAAADTPTSTAADDEGDTGAAGETTIDNIVFHEPHWVPLEDSLGRPVVRFSAIVENTGPHPVDVSISFTPYDSDGDELGGLIEDWDETLGAGLRLPVVLGSGPLDTSPADVEPDISIRQIPDFRRERYGQVLLEGEVVDVEHEVRTTDVFLTFTVSATNAGTAGVDFGIFPHVAIRDASGMLIDAGLTGPGIMGLCPGESTTAETTYRVFDDEFDAEAASYELFFPDVEAYEPMDC